MLCVGQEMYVQIINNDIKCNKMPILLLGCHDMQGLQQGALEPRWQRSRASGWQGLQQGALEPLGIKNTLKHVHI